ncbi:MAG: Wzz/FepE/Etk N-terminal domain-containing protein, partial [Actinomycetota bacterium]|nr:Wzz/FepE/Etk N-terminal domain-containing protein [Actinomycetota bacterium]
MAVSAPVKMRAVSSESHREAPELRHYLSVVRRRKAPLLLTVVVCVAAALISSLIQKPVYAATAEVLLEGRTTEAIFDPTTGRASDPQRTLQTQLRVIQSEPLRAAAAEKLGYKADISVRPASETDVILLRAENVVPKRAADIANAYADAYIDFRRKRYIDDALAASSEVQGKIDVLQGQIDQLGARLSEIPPCIGNNPPRECGERDSIQQDRDAKVAQIVPFRQKLDELQLTASLQTGGAQV